MKHARLFFRLALAWTLISASVAIGYFAFGDEKSWLGGVWTFSTVLGAYTALTWRRLSR